MGCFIVCARPVEFHQKMHNFVKKKKSKPAVIVSFLKNGVAVRWA